MTQPRSAWLRVLGATLALLCPIVAMSSGGIARADTGGATFEEGNRAFAEGRYADAIAAFETLARTHGWSAPLLYDLANAYARQGSVGRAVLSYERAELLAPRDADVAANVAMVRASAALPTPARPWYESLARLLSSTAWTILAACGLWLAVLVFAASRKWRSRWLRYAAAVAAFAAMIPIAGAAVLDRDLDDAVVVASKSTPVRVSPFASAADEATVNEGEQVAGIGRHADFVRVRYGQSHEGWVESAAVQLVAARHF